MGETSGGAPYGLTIDDFRRLNEEHEHDRPWARAKRALRTALARLSPGARRIEVDYVESWGRGCSRDAYAAQVEVEPDPDGFTGPFIALLAHRAADAGYPSRVQREARVLDWVWPRIRGVRVPRPLGLLHDEHAPLLAEGLVTGIEVDLRFGRMPLKPWEVVAKAAAAVHRVELPPEHVLPVRDRAQHRGAIFRELFDGREILPAAVRDARAWMLEHRDRPGPGVLLHGDLLGRNLRLHPGEDLGLIDWEYTESGDPAHDLAIVARGVRRVFQHEHGRTMLLTVYSMNSGAEVLADDLRFFELALHARWALAQDGQNDPVHLHTIAALLRGA